MDDDILEHASSQGEHHPSSKSQLLACSFNQDGGCLAVGTTSGFSVHNLYPHYSLSVDRQLRGGIGHVEMLFRCNLMGLVGGGPTPHSAPHRVLIWDDHVPKEIGELSFRQTVLKVKLRKDAIAVALRDRVYVYHLADLSLRDKIYTADNPHGLLSLSTQVQDMVLACPSVTTGHVRVELYGLRKTVLIEAHESTLRALTLTANGSLLATASHKGTVIRVWNVSNSQNVHEFRRGVERAQITCLAFSWDDQFLSCASDKGTTHIFYCDKDGKNNNAQGSSSSNSSSSAAYFLTSAAGSLFSGSAKQQPKSVCQIRGVPHPMACAFIGDAPNLIAVAGWDADGNGVLLISEFAAHQEARRVAYHVLVKNNLTQEETEEQRRRRRARGWKPTLPETPDHHFGNLQIGDLTEGQNVFQTQTTDDDFCEVTFEHPRAAEPVIEDKNPNDTTVGSNSKDIGGEDEALSDDFHDASDIDESNAADAHAKNDGKDRQPDRSTSTTPTQKQKQYNEAGECIGPRPSVKEVLACQLSSWYSTFANIHPLAATDETEEFEPPPLSRKNVTIPSVVIGELPHDFKEYLLSDGVRLPKNSNLSSTADVNLKKPAWDDSNSDDGDWSQSSPQQQQKDFDFTDLNHRIESILKQEPFSKVNGAAFPKLNWSCPKDASWMNGGSMKCTTPGDVYLLLKASDFCLHDVLMKTLKECHDFMEGSHDQQSIEARDTKSPPLQIVLRKWCNLHPSMEFRCFVRQHNLIAISQRHHSQHYPHLKRDWPNIRDKLDDFFEGYVRMRYANGTIENYVVDLYIDQKDRIWIIDFNCWSFTTDALLFEWQELLTKDQDAVEEEPVEMRIVETAQEVRADPLSSYRAPVDTVDLAAMTQGNAKQFEDFMKMCQKPSVQEVEGSDNDSST